MSSPFSSSRRRRRPYQLSSDATDAPLRRLFTALFALFALLCCKWTVQSAILFPVDIPSFLSANNFSFAQFCWYSQSDIYDNPSKHLKFPRLLRIPRDSFEFSTLFGNVAARRAFVIILFIIQRFQKILKNSLRTVKILADFLKPLILRLRWSGYADNSFETELKRYFQDPIEAIKSVELMTL